MERINSEILKLAREARYTTQEELASSIGVEQGTLSKIEKGILQADEQILKNISEVLDFPSSFFHQDKKVIPVEGHYRRKIDTPIKRLKQYVAQMTIAEWHFMVMLDEVDLPDLKLPSWNVLDDGSPSICAKFLREYWRIANGRITNFIKTVEDNGIIVIGLDFSELDGFSTFFNGNIPVIFVNKALPPDRYRLTVAHELGHLIMHFGNKIGPDREIETEAYEFAIELLVPENNIRQYFSKLSIEKLADLKSYWYVSMAALLKYSNSLGMTTDNQYRYLWTQIGSLGYKVKEPVTIPSDKPGILNEIINAYLSDLGYTKEELASVLHLNIKEFERIYLDSKVKLKVV